MKFSFQGKRWAIVLLHTVCWIVIFSLPFFLRTTYKHENKAPQPDDKAWLYFYFISSFIWVLLFYLNAYVLLPLMARTKKVLVFIALHIAALGVVYFLHWLYFDLFMQQTFKPAYFFISNIFP